MERRRDGRQREVAALEELSGRRLLEALEADWVTVMQRYVIAIRYAAWCTERCECAPQRGGARACRHRDSDEYVEYEIREVEGTARADVPERSQMKIVAQRIGTSDGGGGTGRRSPGDTWPAW